MPIVTYAASLRRTAGSEHMPCTCVIEAPGGCESAGITSGDRIELDRRRLRLRRFCDGFGQRSSPSEALDPPCDAQRRPSATPVARYADRSLCGVRPVAGSALNSVRPNACAGISTTCLMKRAPTSSTSSAYAANAVSSMTSCASWKCEPTQMRRFPASAHTITPATPISSV